MLAPSVCLFSRSNLFKEGHGDPRWCTMVNGPWRSKIDLGSSSSYILPPLVFVNFFVNCRNSISLQECIKRLFVITIINNFHCTFGRSVY